jgi:hypothetical protein
MKRTLFFALLFVSLSAYPQNSEPAKKLPRGLIKISPLQFFSQTLELSVETLNVDYTRAFQVSAGFRSGQGDYIDGHGANFSLAYRKYVRPLSTPTTRNPDAVQGIYYNIFLKGEYFKGEEEYWGQSQFERTKEVVRSLSPGFTIGLQRTIFDVLFMEVFIGGGIKFVDVEYSGIAPSDQINYDLFHPAYEGIYPSIGMKIGVGL